MSGHHTPHVALNHAQGMAGGCTLNVFLRFWRKRSLAEYVTIWLSSDVPMNHCVLGWTLTAGTECMPGSAMYLICTGMPNSQQRIVLSSEVVTKRRPSSTNVTVLTAAR